MALPLRLGPQSRQAVARSRAFVSKTRVSLPHRLSRSRTGSTYAFLARWQTDLANAPPPRVEPAATPPGNSRANGQPTNRPAIQADPHAQFERRGLHVTLRFLFVLGAPDITGRSSPDVAEYRKRHSQSPFSRMLVAPPSQRRVVRGCRHSNPTAPHASRDILAEDPKELGTPPLRRNESTQSVDRFVEWWRVESIWDKWHRAPFPVPFVNQAP